MLGLGDAAVCAPLLCGKWWVLWLGYGGGWWWARRRKGAAKATGVGSAAKAGGEGQVVGATWRERSVLRLADAFVVEVGEESEQNGEYPEAQGKAEDHECQGDD